MENKEVSGNGNCKGLNQLLPSDILNDIDIDASATAEENNQYDEEEEIVDDLAYHLKPGTSTGTNNGMAAKPMRFNSDSNVFLRTMMNQYPIIKQPMPSSSISNSICSNMNYSSMQSSSSSSMYSMNYNNALFSINQAYFNSNNSTIGMGFPYRCIPIERKRTDPYFFNNNNTNPYYNLNLHNQYPNNQMTNPNNTSYLSHNSRKKTNSSSNFNQTKTKGSTRSAKGSFDSTSLQFNVEQFEIEDFNNFIDSLHCEVHDYICSQKGTKEMQKYLNKSPPDCKTILINTLKHNMTKVMMDKCGNYFTQQFFQSCSSSQLILLMNYINADIVRIAKNSSGTHALQALIDLFSSIEEEALMLSAIHGHETEMMYDNNATHVLQKLITSINEENRSQMTIAVISNIVSLCYDPNGICVAKKLIKTTNSLANKKIIIKAITSECIDIAQDAYGNYAIQCLFEEWSINEYDEMIKILIDNVEVLSIQKFSSNVIEKMIEYINDDKRSILFNKMFNTNTVLRILKMRYGKYVLQKAIKYTDLNQKKEIRKALMLVVPSCQKETNKIEAFISHLDNDYNNDKDET